MLVPQTAHISTFTPVQGLPALRPDALEQLLREPRRERVERLDAGLRAQPRHLAFRQLPSGYDRLLARRGPIIPPLEVSPYLAVPDRPHRRRGRVEIAPRHQRFDFLH